MKGEQEKRWRAESEFFDRQASEEVRPQAMDPRAVERYAGQRLRDRYQKEYRFRLLGDAAGKHILDVGCGSGVNAVLLALLGAQVTGVDVSDGAIKQARMRALASGVADRCRFICAPVEQFSPDEGPFDVVWCDSILHHLIDNLEPALQRILRVARPGALVIIYEPVSRSDLVKKLRGFLPSRDDVTADERPLGSSEITGIASSLEDPVLRYFSILERGSRFILRGEILERVSPVRRFAVYVLVTLDQLVLKLPLVNRAAGRIVIHGSVAP